MDRLVTLGRRAPILTGNDDRYFDYCLQPYQPRRPTAGKLRSENLLWRSADIVGVAAGFEPALRAVQRAAGRDLTVFGIKHQDGRMWWELYFYDVDREKTALRASQFPAVTAPHLDFAIRPREAMPYFMVSFDVFPDLRPVETMSYYLPSYQVQGGRSYELGRNGFELQNFYRFHHPKREIAEILHDVRASVFVDYERVPLSKVLLPELFACDRICVAKKRRADALYHSGIDVEQLLFFLRRYGWPAPFVDYVAEERGRLDHLRLAVGVDFVMNDDGAVVALKSSCYGTL